MGMWPVMSTVACGTADLSVQGMCISVHLSCVRNPGVCRSLGAAGSGCTSGTCAWPTLGYWSWHSALSLYIQANGTLQCCRLASVHMYLLSLPAPLPRQMLTQHHLLKVLARRTLEVLALPSLRFRT